MMLPASAVVILGLLNFMLSLWDCINCCLTDISLGTCLFRWRYSDNVSDSIRYSLRESTDLFSLTIIDIDRKHLNISS